MAQDTCSECGDPVLARGWCAKHYQRWLKYGDPSVIHNGPRQIESERFWTKVDKGGPLPAGRPELGPCWLWTAGTRYGGYGAFRIGSRSDGTSRHIGAHTWAYEYLVGEVPDGLELDHLCRIPPCVRPTHLEPVTHQENILRGDSPFAIHARKTRCPQGHEYSGVDKRGQRICRECIRLQGAESSARYRLRKLTMTASGG